jgi:hypothetical protein
MNTNSNNQATLVVKSDVKAGPEFELVSEE